MITNPPFTHFYCSTWRLGKQQLMAQEGLNVWTAPSGCLRNQPGLFVPICSVALRSKSLEPMLICSLHISICVCSNTVGHLFTSFTSILFTYSSQSHTRPRAIWTFWFNVFQQFWTFGLVIILRGLQSTWRQLPGPCSSPSLPIPWRLGLNAIPASPPPHPSSIEKLAVCLRERQRLCGFARCLWEGGEQRIEDSPLPLISLPASPFFQNRFEKDRQPPSAPALHPSDA